MNSKYILQVYAVTSCRDCEYLACFIDMTNLVPPELVHPVAAGCRDALA